MAKTVPTLKFKAKLHRPETDGRAASWTFLRLPKTASAKLPSRSMTSVEGTLNGADFRATLEPDGEGSHWLKVGRKLREAAEAKAGDIVGLVIAPLSKEPEPRVPADLRKALAASPEARATWTDVTLNARRDWIHWITSGKRAETAPNASTPPATCSPTGSGARAVSTGPGCIARASAVLSRPTIADDC